MEIRQERFLEFLGRENTRFVIPVFQRVYSWDARQCEELWEDVVEAGAGDGRAHFAGMLLYAADAESWQGAQQFDVIDGQQRMTTVSLLLCALARLLDESHSEVGGVSAAELFARYLRIGSGAGASGKLVLSSMDRETLFALVGCGVMPVEPAGRLIDNLELFYAKMGEPGFDVEQLWRGLGRLEVASVLLAHDDGPQIVFESLNSKGKALTLADRVRNYAVVADGAIGQSALYERSWLPFEELVAETEGLDATIVLIAWLAKKYRELRIFDESEAYGVFKRSLRDDYRGNLARALADAADYANELIADAEYRAEELENAQRWVAGKPKELISEYKMFGD